MQETKALHLQKQQVPSTKVWGERKNGLRVWSLPEQGVMVKYLLRPVVVHVAMIKAKIQTKGGFSYVH